jgi:ribosomal protein S18 acetylase RimI-like enzyme
MFDPETIDSALRVVHDLRLARVEEAGLNASQPREQLLFDGWLLRFSPGKARRARSINAIADGELPLDKRVETCRRWYDRFRLPLLVRVTPFSRPARLDEYLATAGFVAGDETRVMTCGLDRIEAAATETAAREVDACAFAAVVGRLRGSAPGQVEAHQRRLLDSPLKGSTVRLVAFGKDDAPLAAGQVVVENELAGVYDIVTAEHVRSRGYGRAISRQLLAAAAALGADTAYLQVDAGNASARRIYSALGFADRYAYWYRQPADAVEAVLPQEGATT